MTTETNSDKQTEPRLLSEAETDAVAGGNVAHTAYVGGFGRPPGFLPQSNLAPQFLPRVRLT